MVGEVVCKDGGVSGAHDDMDESISKVGEEVVVAIGHGAPAVVGGELRSMALLMVLQSWMWKPWMTILAMKCMVPEQPYCFPEQQ